MFVHILQFTLAKVIVGKNHLISNKDRADYPSKVKLFMIILTVLNLVTLGVCFINEQAHADNIARYYKLWIIADCFMLVAVQMNIILEFYGRLRVEDQLANWILERS